MLLSACFLADQATNGYATVKRDGPDLFIAVCTDVQVGSISFGEEGSSVAEGDKAFWEAETSVRTLRRGDVLSTNPDVTPAIPGEYRRSPKLEAGGTIFVALSKSQEAVAGITALFEIPENGLSSSHWLHENGNTTRDPCDGIYPAPK